MSNRFGTKHSAILPFVAPVKPLFSTDEVGLASLSDFVELFDDLGLTVSTQSLHITSRLIRLNKQGRPGLADIDPFFTTRAIEPMNHIPLLRLIGRADLGQGRGGPVPTVTAALCTVLWRFLPFA